MDSLRISQFSPSLLLLLLAILATTSPSRQDVLSCGSTTYQVSFEPNRPIFTSFISSAHNVNAASPSASNGMGTGPAAAQQGSSNAQLGSSSSTAKYIYKALDQFLPAGAQVCNLGPSLSQLPPPPVPLDPPRFGSGGGGRIPIGSFDGRLVVTKCENCSDCPVELPFIHRFLTRRALDSSLLSLLVIVPHKEGQFDHVRLAENTNTKFVFMEEDVQPTQLAFCELADNGDSDALKSFSRTSVLFVSISFIILMVISLAWLVFYYVQRFRYAHAKDRLQRRLFNAAKKALTRIPTRPVKAGDKELDSDCPVCIDPYRQGDIVRMLPCRHIFHKSCVDPWLLEHRTCPMCKSDILKAFGYHVSVSSRRRAQFSSSIVGMDDDGGGAGRSTVRGNDSDHLSMDANSSTGSESNFPFPVVSEVHDPFSFSPSSPQLVQVMHATNARAFSIIPLTVHSPALERHSPPSSARSVKNPHPSQTGIIVDSSAGGGGSPDASSTFAVAGSIEHHEPATLPPSPPLAAKPQQQDEMTGSRAERRKYSSTDGVSINARLFRAMTGSGQRRRLDASNGDGVPHGHVVNLVHVRSRSLSQSQIQTALSGEGNTQQQQDGRPTAVLRTTNAASPHHQQQFEMAAPSGAVTLAESVTGVEPSSPAERQTHSSESVRGRFVRKQSSGKERSSAAQPAQSASAPTPTSPPSVKRPNTIAGRDVEMGDGVDTL